MKAVLFIIRFIFPFLFLISTLNIFAAGSQREIDTLTPQKAPNGKWGYVDADGCYRIKPIFDLAFPFKEGMALVSILKKYGYIDLQGKPVIRP